jgi:hypothetical protein
MYVCAYVRMYVCAYVRMHVCMYRGAGKSLVRPGRKQATATEGFDVHTSYLLSQTFVGYISRLQPSAYVTYHRV